MLRIKRNPAHILHDLVVQCCYFADGRISAENAIARLSPDDRYALRFLNGDNHFPFRNEYALALRSSRTNPGYVESKIKVFRLK